MPTYDNPATGVVHWIPTGKVSWVRTACHFLDRGRLSWDWNNLDPVGVPADVTCCHCRETAEFLDEAQKAAEAERSES